MSANSSIQWTDKIWNPVRGCSIVSPGCVNCGEIIDGSEWPLFDQLGIVKQRKRDPIIVGQLIDPRDKHLAWETPKVVTFFVAWWLNTEDL